MEESQRRLDGGVARAGLDIAAGQGQIEVGTAADDHPLVERDGLHGHIQRMVAAGQDAHHVQRQIQLGRGQDRHNRAWFFPPHLQFSFKNSRMRRMASIRCSTL